MQVQNTQITDILTKQHFISDEDAKKALEYCDHHHNSVVDYLLEHDVITKDLLGQAMSEAYGLPYANLTAHTPSQSSIVRIPEEIAKNDRVVMYEEMENEVKIATDNPAQPGLYAILQSIFPNKKVTLSYSLPEDMANIFLRYKRSLDDRCNSIIQTSAKIAPDLLDEIIKEALDAHSSDIHFEPQEERILFRFRIDGVLSEVGTIPKEYYTNLINRLKVSAKLRIDEHNAPQDGAIQYKNGPYKVDMRLSIVPTIYGEKVVIRILPQYVKSFGMTDLGLSEKNQHILEEAAQKPFGMILVTGPTGSGKSTTLYAVLRMLNHPEINITTVEDPVEYKVPGINQIQVNPAKNLTFASALRYIVRQDPDVIFVGEIRDRDTAEISINAALTGHLLLSTFHTNDAATAIPRLLDMGIEPFLLASTLQVVIAQRLVRKICDHCRYTYNPTISELEHILPQAKKYFDEDKITLYKGKGCESCGYKGYKGRIAVFEFIEATPEMKELILTIPSTQKINTLAEKQGARFLFQDGMEKVKNGITTLEELLRVVEEGYSNCERGTVS